MRGTDGERRAAATTGRKDARARLRRSAGNPHARVETRYLREGGSRRAGQAPLEARKQPRTRASGAHDSLKRATCMESPGRSRPSSNTTAIRTRSQQVMRATNSRSRPSNDARQSQRDRPGSRQATPRTHHRNELSGCNACAQPLETAIPACNASPAVRDHAEQQYATGRNSASCAHPATRRPRRAASTGRNASYRKTTGTRQPRHARAAFMHQSRESSLRNANAQQSGGARASAGTGGRSSSAGTATKTAPMHQFGREIRISPGASASGSGCAAATCGPDSCDSAGAGSRGCAGPGPGTATPSRSSAASSRVRMDRCRGAGASSAAVISRTSLPYL